MRTMEMRHPCKILALALMCMGVAQAANITIPEQIAPGWVRAEPSREFVGNDLYGHINGGAELFHELGFKDLTVQSYASGPDEINLEVYRMTSPGSALGIYLWKCRTEKPVKAVGARNTVGAYQLSAVKGDCFVQINNFGGDSALIPIMISLAHSALEGIDEGSPVTLFDRLPKEQLKPGSELLIRGQYGLQPIFTFGKGDILKLGGKVFGLVGDYVADNDSVYTRIIIPYPDEKEAGAAFMSLLANLDAYLTVLGETDSTLVFRDYGDRYGAVTLIGRELDISIGLSDEPTPMEH